MPNTITHLVVAAATVFIAATLSTSQAAEVSTPHFAPLASQSGVGFGQTIIYVASGYTPPGITSLVRSPLASHDHPQFGAPIFFVASGYTPPAAIGLNTIHLVVAQ